MEPFSPEDYILYATTAEGVQIRIPQNHGHWDGIPGESGWHSNQPEVIAVTGGIPIQFRNGFPDFGPWTQMRVPLENMKGDYEDDFAEADNELARRKGWFNPDGTPDRRRAVAYRDLNNLTWHHHEDTVHMDLVPKALNNRIPHTGGAAIVKARARGGQL